MKAKSVNESVEFKRGIDSKEGMDVGIQRSDNPNNLLNHESYLIAKTNGEIIEGQMEILEDFHRALNADIAPMDDEGNITPLHQKRAEKLSDIIHKIESGYDELELFLKGIKI